MPILEKRGISIKDYMRERLLYTGWSPDTFLRMCRNSLEQEKDLMIIDGTTEFTIPLSNLKEYFAPKVEEVVHPVEHKPEAVDVAPIEAKPVTKPRPRPRTKRARAKKK